MIAFDTSASFSGGTGNISGSFTTSGSNRLLLVGIGWAEDSSNTVDTITYNGVTLTKIGEVLNYSSGGNPRSIALYYLINPASGSNTLAITRSTSTNGFYAYAASYTGVLQSGALDASDTGSTTTGDTYADSLTSVTDGCWHLWFVGAFNDIPTAGASTTARGDGVYTFALMDSNSEKTPAGSVTLNAALTGNSYWANVIAAFKPFVGSPSPSLSTSLSPSLSDSVSVSPTPSSSVSLSISLSPSLSVSLSSSASQSPSSSVSPSLSVTGSPSPSSSQSITESISVSRSISLSPSVSASVSLSLSPSISASLSPSKSASGSSSRSQSPSHSPSPSVSVSLSASISDSISPSQPVADYTREAKVALPSDKTDLATVYTTQEEADLTLNDNIDVDLTGAASRYLIHQYKILNTNRVDRVTIRVEALSEVSTTDSTAYLQAWNGQTGAWETIDSDNETEASTKFSLSGELNDTSYYDFNNEVAIRVYQRNTSSSNAMFSVDLLKVTFWANFYNKYLSRSIGFTEKYPHN